MVHDTTDRHDAEEKYRMIFEQAQEGVFVATEGLAWPAQAKIVRAGQNGEPVTDGVFPESKEFLAGYWIVDVETPEDAYRIAARASQQSRVQNLTAIGADLGHERVVLPS